MPWELPRQKKLADVAQSLFGRQYLTLIIDEAHHMRNIGAKYYAALRLGQLSLVKLVMTATPLQTSPKASERTGLFDGQLTSSAAGHPLIGSDRWDPAFSNSKLRRRRESRPGADSTIEEVHHTSAKRTDGGCQRSQISWRARERYSGSRPFHPHRADQICSKDANTIQWPHCRGIFVIVSYLYLGISSKFG
jgi:hypothetical protein